MRGHGKFSFSVDRTGAGPTGSAYFTFRRGLVRFGGTTVMQAVVSGKTITMSVAGTNYGQPGFTLQIVAYDGRVKDKVLVRLLDGSTVVYDSKPTRPGSDTPANRVHGVVNVVS